VGVSVNDGSFSQFTLAQTQLHIISPSCLNWVGFLRRQPSG